MDKKGDRSQGGSNLASIESDQKAFLKTKTAQKRRILIKRGSKPCGKGFRPKAGYIVKPGFNRKQEKFEREFSRVLMKGGGKLGL